MPKKTAKKPKPEWEPAPKAEKPRPKPTPEPERPERPDPEAPVRLNRFIGQAGICSRREADALITRGEIKVNGSVVTALGTKIVPGRDRVEYQGRLLTARTYVYILLNKPKNMITTMADPKGRRIVLEAIERATQERVFPVGRLDRNTTGLLLLTNDGDLAKKLTHPSHRIKKLYHVRLDKPVTEEDMQQLLTGVTLDDGPAKVDKIDYVAGRGPEEVGVEVHIGRNRIVRRLFEHLGYQVEALDRTLLGPLDKRNLPRGKWRHLTPKEVAFMKMLR